MYVNEVLLTKDVYTQEDWRQFVLSIAKQIGGLSPFTLVVQTKDNNLRFFIVAKSDISGLSSTQEGFLLRAAGQVNIEVPENAQKMGFLKIPNGGNIIDIIEQNHLKEGKDITLIRLSIHRIADKLNSTMTVVAQKNNVPFVSKQHLALFPAHFFIINISESQNYIFTTLPKYLSLEKTMHVMDTVDNNALLSVPGFPYSPRDYYLSMSSYEFDKHSLIVGASGSGKSKLIQLYIDRLSKHGTAQNQYRVIVIDPHASLEQDLQHITNSRIINLGSESAQLFPDASADISAATELTSTLFQSLLQDQFNPRLDRVLRFSVYVLLTAQAMSLDGLKTFLTDLDTRSRVLDHVKGYVPPNIQQFFATDFNEIRTQFYNEGILPIVSLVDEMQLQPSLVGEAAQSLYTMVKDNFLTVFSLNKVSMGEKAVKTVAGLLIQQIFLLAQSRIMPYKLILVVDEVSVVQNPALAAILAEARKFNLTLIMAQQYFSQVDIDIQDAILSNVVNYYIFRVSKDDAKKLEGNIAMDVPDEILVQAKRKGQKDANVKVDLLTDQSARECIVRVSANGQLLPAMQAKTVTVQSSSFGPENISVSTQLQKLPPKLDMNNLQESAPVFKSLDAAASPSILQSPSAAPMHGGTSMNQPIDDDVAPALEKPVELGSTPPDAQSATVPSLMNIEQFTLNAANSDSSESDMPKELDPFDEAPKFINFQQILADQSSSRDFSRKELTNE